MNKSTLSKLGLTYPADKIYISLLKNHRSSIAEISRDTGLYRPLIYRTLPRLLDNNLITKIIIGKRTLYIAENPTKLQNMVTAIKNELEAELPDLTRMFEGSQQRPVMRYFEGKKAIQDIYEEMIRRSKKGDEVYRYESPRDFKIIGKYYPSLYWQRATGPQGEIEKYVITNEETSQKRSDRLWRHTKHIPSDFDSFDYNITQLIYKDTVAFIDFDTETATLIQNKRFADFQLKIFRMLFKKL
jgi:sugar-specific transcriptional regulator TrmB